MKIIRFLLLTLSFLLMIQACFASSHNIIKLAVFDNPQQDVSNSKASQSIVDAYLRGINTAVQAALQDHIHIDAEEFFYSDNALEIMHKAADVKAWDPNVILGFHASNDFLLAKTFFDDQLVLSIAATDKKLSTLPNAFYSIGAPDANTDKAIIRFIDKHYPNSNLFITVGAENKESIDFANILASDYKKEHPALSVIERQYLSEDLNILSMNELMACYHADDVIVSMSQGYFSGIGLMNKIAKYLSPIKPIFVTSSDNWGSDGIPQPMIGEYNAFRIDTFSGGENTMEYKIFVKEYQKIYHTAPSDAISYVTYRGVMSFVTALKRYPPPSGLNMTQAVLWSYHQALKDDPNWFRAQEYSVFKLTPTKEVYFETLRQPKDVTNHGN